MIPSAISVYSLGAAKRATMAPRDSRDPSTTDFRVLLLTLRGRASHSQRELAALLGVSERAAQTWAAGLSYPNARACST